MKYFCKWKQYLKVNELLKNMEGLPLICDRLF